MEPRHVAYVSSAGRTETKPLAELSVLEPADLLPIRLKTLKSTGDTGRHSVLHAKRPTNYRGQRHIGGTYWFTRVGRRLPYASGLERLRLQVADLDPLTVGAVTQPYALFFGYEGQPHVHVPDLLLRRRGQRKLLVDIRPWALQHDPNSQAIFAITHEICNSAGLDYEVWGEPSTVETYNTRFLSGFRREPLGFGVVATRLVECALHEPQDIASLVREVAPTYFSRPALYHLIWRSDLRFDMGRPLGNATVILPGPLAARLLVKS